MDIVLKIGEKTLQRIQVIDLMREERLPILEAIKEIEEEQKELQNDNKQLPEDQEEKLKVISQRISAHFQGTA